MEAFCSSPASAEKSKTNIQAITWRADMIQTDTHNREHGCYMMQRDV